MTDEILTSKKVAAEYPLSTQQLASMRCMGTGPDYIKTSPSKAGRVLYRRSAIEAWFNARTVHASGKV